MKYLTLQASVFYGINQFEHVIETINRGFELAPDFYYIHYMKVNFLITTNRTDELLNLIVDLVGKFPDFKYILYERKF